MKDEKRDDLLKDGEEKVDEVLQDIEKQKIEVPPPPQPTTSNKVKKQVTLIIIVFVLFIASLYYNYIKIKEMNAPLVITEEEKMASLKNYIYLVNAKILLFKEKSARLPNDLSEIFIEDTNLTYIINDDSLFSLLCRYDDLSYTYESTDDPEELLSGEFLENLNKK